MSETQKPMASPPKRKRKSPRKTEPVTIILTVLFAVLAVSAGVVAFNIIRNLTTTWTATDLPGIAIQQQQMPSEGELLEGTEYTEPLQEAGGPTPQPWDGVSRINMLVMGLDYRDWQAGEIPRTDSMILFTLDPVSKKAGMLSIPRDLWVNIPGFDYGKINTAYFLGESNNMPGGGPGLAIKTVEAFLGVPINYYAQIDFQAFVEFIDEIGGIDLHIHEEIKVDPLGAGNTVVLQPGVQTLDGAVALAYARARYTEGGDFDRSKRQQEVIMAILDNILNFYSLPKLVMNAPTLYQQLSAGINTNMSLNEAIQFAWLIPEINIGDIKQSYISPDMVTFGTYQEQAIMIPIPDEIRIIRDDLFATGGSISPAQLEANISELILEENTNLSVQNGTNVEGLAQKTSDYLTNQGLNIVEQTNAAEYHEYSQIIIYNGKPYTIQYIADLIGIPSSRIFTQYNPDSNMDVVLIVGNDWANNELMNQ